MGPLAALETIREDIATLGGVGLVKALSKINQHWISCSAYYYLNKAYINRGCGNGNVSLFDETAGHEDKLKLISEAIVIALNGDK